MNHKSFRFLDETVRNFLAYLEGEQVSYDKNLTKLNIFLDEISLARHSIPYASLETFSDSQKLDYKIIRKLVIEHFPNLGLYNLPQEITDKVGETNIVIGDAVDDITDIACELSGIIWCFDHTDENDAAWHFHFGYEHHWGKHLRALQFYLYSLQYEART